MLQTALGTTPALKRRPDDEPTLLTGMTAPLSESATQIGMARLDRPDFYRPLQSQIRREQECRRPRVVSGIVSCFNEVSSSSGMSTPSSDNGSVKR